MLTYSDGYLEVYRRFQVGFLGFEGGGVEKTEICSGELSMEEFIMGKKIFMKGTQDFLALFKKKTMKK